MRWIRIGKVTALLALTLTLLAGCGGDAGTSSTPPTLADAWVKFASGDYASAITTFNAVLTDDPSLNDGNNGLGWSHAFNGGLTSAKTSFETALSNNSALTEAHAGLCAVLLAIGDHAGAIVHATTVLDADSEWEFSHADGVDHDDMRLIRAQAYFAQGATSLADAQSDLDAIDPANGLDFGDSATWNGEPSYAIALLKALQAAEDTVGAEMMF